MTPGPVEEAGAAARIAISGLSSAPVMLAVVLLQFLLILAISYIGLKRMEHDSRDFRLIMERCLPLARLPPSTTTPPDD